MYHSDEDWVKPQVCLLKNGDTLYVPSFWYRATLNLSPSFGLVGITKTESEDATAVQKLCIETDGKFQQAYTELSISPFVRDQSGGYVRAAWDQGSTRFAEASVKKHPQNTQLIDILIKNYAMSEDTLHLAHEWEKKLRSLDPYFWGSANRVERVLHTVWSGTQDAQARAHALQKHEL
jgi:hypothetical protein